MTVGGVLCENCRPGKRGVVSVSSGVIEMLRQATTGTEADRELEASIRGELRAVMSNYFAHLVGRRLRMSEYLGVQAG
jgi:hypothetical protein